MDYSQINNFLEKFKNTLFKRENIYKDVIDSILKETGINLNVDDIKIKGTEVKIKSSPIIKNEILIHKSSILTLLKDKQPENRYTDIN